jgi:hypothetical protein
MPARTLNDFLAGFFYGQIGVELEVKMAIPMQKVQGKVNQIKAEGECEKEKEVIVHHEIGSPKWRTWDHDDISRDWQRNYSV